MVKFGVLAALVGALGIGSFCGAARQMEALDRGLVAVKTGSGVFLSWRILGTEGFEVGFNVYRDGTKIASVDGSGASNYVDEKGTLSNKYSVRAVVNGTENSEEKIVSVWSDQYKVIDLDRPAAGSNKSGSYTYSPNDIAVGDVDGDGEFELILKWDPSNSQDNSKSGYTGNVFIDCYKLSGQKLWRIDLGVNIRAGAHYTQMLVGDYDSDGKAEVALKTAPGTKDGTGTYISKGPAEGVDHSKDYRNSSGYILSGDEFLTIFNGETGAEMATVNFNPARGTVSSWGDKYGNRVDRFLATNAYLDGQKPSMVFQRGYYTRMAITAYDWDGISLTQRWYYNAATSGKECYGQGNHNLSAGDVDNDGFDEIIEGACAVDHDGKFMYSTKRGHGDAIHFGDLDPDRPGLEVWEVHEDAPYGVDLHDARTGEIIWSYGSEKDNGRGLAADIDPATRGYEMWSTANYNVHSAPKGDVVAGSRPSVNFRVYWDGDLQDELLDGTKITKWSNGKISNLVTLLGNSCNSTKATPNFSGDLFGDWREEVITHDGASKLYVYTTTIPTTNRLYTLAHDPIYRNGMSWQNTAYNQPPHLGFWLGAGTDKAPKPDIVLVGGTKIPAILKQGAGSSFQTIMQGDPIVEYAFGYTNCTGLKITGLPAGVTAVKDAAKSRYVFSGTPVQPGIFNITIETEGAAAGVDNVTRGARITVLAHTASIDETGEILSSVEGATPTDGVGTFETNHEGFLGEGFFDFTNIETSYGIWKLNSEKAHDDAILTIRYAHGKTDTRQMHLTIANAAGEEVSYGVLTFPSTENWDSWNTVSVKVKLEKGLNVLKLQSVSLLGGANIDELEFNVAGVTMYVEEVVENPEQDLEEPSPSEESSSSIENESSSSAVVSGSSSSVVESSSSVIASSSSVAGSSSSAVVAGSSSSASTAITKNDMGFGVRLNAANATLFCTNAGFVHVTFFDMQGHVITRFAANVQAGSVSIANTLGNLEQGMYIAQIKFNGKVLKKAEMVRIAR